MIRNDLHAHSLQSFCGFHTVLEIAQIAVNKKMNIVNIADHGSGLGRVMNFGVITDKRRLPNPVLAPDGRGVNMLRGIEANFMDVEGNTDIPAKQISQFDLISIGFHFCGLPQNGPEKDNMAALRNALKKYPIDHLTHPCIKTYPLDIPAVVDLSLEYGFALEINNTNLRVSKTNLQKLEQMILLGIEKQAVLIETSDGHTYTEIGENEKVEELLQRLGLNGDDFLLNREDEKLMQFVDSRIAKRNS